jgi:hypothetical protein
MNDVPTYFIKKIKTINKVIKNNTIPQKLITIFERPSNERREKCVKKKKKKQTFLSQTRFISR